VGRLKAFSIVTRLLQFKDLFAPKSGRTGRADDFFQRLLPFSRASAGDEPTFFRLFRFYRIIITILR